MQKNESDMLNLYVDEIKLSNEKSEEEIEKYFINPYMSDKEYIDYIFEKGLFNQKQCIVNNFFFYSSNGDLYSHYLSSLINHISVFDDDMHLAMCKGILGVFDSKHLNLNEKINSLYSPELITKQLFFLIKQITKTEGDIREAYMNCLTSMTNYISNNIKIKIADEILEFINSYGRIGKTTSEKKICVYLCSQILQIESTSNSDIIKKFVQLHTDIDKNVKKEIAFQIRFIAKEKDVTFFIKNFLNIIYLYLDETDLNVKTEVIISSIKNLDRVYDDDSFLKNLSNVIIELIQDDKLLYKESSHKITRIVKTILVESQEKIKIAQLMERVVRVIFKVFIFNPEKVQLINISCFVISEFQLFASYLRSLNDLTQLNNLAESLVSMTYNPSYVKLSSPKREFVSQLQHKELIRCFLSNMENIMRYLGKDLINKYILKCYFGHFISITKTVSSAITRDHEHMEFEDDTSDVKKECEDDAVANILLKNLSKIIIVNEKMKNEDFFSQFKSYVNCVFDWLMNEKFCDWRKKKEVIEALKLSKIIFFNDENFADRTASLMLIIAKSSHNYIIQSECLKLSVYLLKFVSKTKFEEIIKTFDKDFLSSKKFYDNRLFIPLFEESLLHFSLEFLKNVFFMNAYIVMLNTNKPIYLPKLINLISHYFPVVNADKDKRLKTAILAKIESLKKSKVKDREVQFSLKKLDMWMENFNKNTQHKEFQQLVDRDKEHFKNEDKSCYMSEYTIDNTLGSITNVGSNNSLKSEKSDKSLKIASSSTIKLNTNANNSDRRAYLLKPDRKDKSNISNTMTEKNKININLISASTATKTSDSKQVTSSKGAISLSSTTLTSSSVVSTTAKKASSGFKK